MTTPLLSEASFKATGTSTARKLGDRHAEVFNVKDRGALGNDSANDYAVIQATLDAAAAVGGKVYFPAGSYRIGQSLNLNYSGDFSLTIEGGGVQNSMITQLGGFSGTYTLQRTNNATSRGGLYIRNMLIGGPMYLSGITGGSIKDCTIGTTTAYDNIFGLLFDNVVFQTGGYTGIGATLGGNCTLLDCEMHGAAEGVRLFGDKGITILGFHCETSVRAFVIGLDQTGAISTLKGAYIAGVSVEAQGIYMEIHSAQGCYFGQLGGAQTSPQSPNATWPGGPSAGYTGNYGLWMHDDSTNYCSFVNVGIGTNYTDYALVLGSGCENNRFEECEFKNRLITTRAAAAGQPVLTFGSIPPGLAVGNSLYAWNYVSSVPSTATIQSLQTLDGVANGSISPEGTVLNVTSVTSGTIEVGASVRGLTSRRLVQVQSQTSGTPGGVGVYATAGEAGSSSSEALRSYCGKVTLTENLVAEVPYLVQVSFFDAGGNDVLGSSIYSAGANQFIGTQGIPVTISRRSGDTILDRTVWPEIELNKSSGTITLSILNDSYFNAPIGAMYRVIQTGAATASIVADNAWGTVNVNFVAGQNISAGQWGVLFARKRAANSWIIWRQG